MDIATDRQPDLEVQAATKETAPSTYRHPLNVAGEPRQLYLAAAMMGLNFALFAILGVGHYSEAGQISVPVVICCTIFLATGLLMRHGAYRLLAARPARAGEGSFLLPALGALTAHLMMFGVVLAIFSEVVDDGSRAAVSLGLYLAALATLIVRGVWNLLRGQTGWILPVLALDAAVFGALITISEQARMLDGIVECAPAFLILFVLTWIVSRRVESWATTGRKRTMA